ncbi:MAG: Holliday junction resolvase RuvX [Thermodesulfobacteriota bacterium]
MRYLGIDFGLKRTGLALTDNAGTMAFPLKTLYKETNQQFWNELLDTIRQEKVEALVVGIPFDLYGQETETTIQAKNFSRRIQKKSGLPVYTVSETCSSIEAKEQLKQAGITKHKLNHYLDQQAAVVILESYLNSR